MDPNISISTTNKRPFICYINFDIFRLVQSGSDMPAYLSELMDSSGAS